MKKFVLLLSIFVLFLKPVMARKSVNELDIIMKTNWSYLLSSWKIGLCWCKGKFGIPYPGIDSENMWPITVVGASFEKDYPYVETMPYVLNKIAVPIQDLQLSAISPMNKVSGAHGTEAMTSTLFYEAQVNNYPDPFSISKIMDTFKELEGIVDHVSEFKIPQTDESVTSNSAGEPENARSFGAWKNRSVKSIKGIASKFNPQTMFNNKVNQVKGQIDSVKKVVNNDFSELSKKYGKLGEMGAAKNPYIAIYEAIGDLLCRFGDKPICYPIWTSELDALNWRTAAGDQLSISNWQASLVDTFSGCAFGGLPGVGSFTEKYCIGGWSPIFPRWGFVHQYNYGRGAAVSVYRALDWSSTGATRINWQYYQPYTNPAEFSRNINVVRGNYPNGPYDPYLDPKFQQGTGNSTRGGRGNLGSGLNSGLGQSTRGTRGGRGGSRTPTPPKQTKTLEEALGLKPNEYIFSNKSGRGGGRVPVVSYTIYKRTSGYRAENQAVYGITKQDKFQMLIPEDIKDPFPLGTFTHPIDNKYKEGVGYVFLQWAKLGKCHPCKGPSRR